LFGEYLLVLGRAFMLYRGNFVLVVPPITSMFVSFLILIVSPQPSYMPPSASAVAPLIAAGFTVLVIKLVVAFLVLLGQVGMTGRGCS